MSVKVSFVAKPNAARVLEPFCKELQAALHQGSLGDFSADLVLVVSAVDEAIKGHSLSLNYQGKGAEQRRVFLTLHLAPQELAFLGQTVVRDRLVRGFLDSLAQRPKRVPTWLNYAELSSALSAALGSWHASFTREEFL